MDLQELSTSEKALIGEALRAAADGPFFPHWEFRTLFGLPRVQVRAIASEWPNLIPPREAIELAVDNSLGNLLGYPHNIEAPEWSRWISVDRRVLGDLFDRLPNGGTGQG
jgi:hypothetical protein